MTLGRACTPPAGGIIIAVTVYIERGRLHILTEAALGYLKLGHHLLALSEKRPNTRYHSKADENDVGWSWEKSIHGVPETEAEIAALDAVFSHPSTTGIAILIPKDRLVADVDTTEAFDLFGALWDGAKTPLAVTPNGVHVWFEALGHDKTLWLGGRTLLFKGFGGYVAAPPSRHFTPEHVEDGVYTWGMNKDLPLAPLSPAMRKELTLARALDSVERIPFNTIENSHTVVTFQPGGGFTLHKDWNLEGLRKAIINAKDGNQNNTIAWAALQARDEGVPLKVAMRGLLSAAIEGRHPRHRAVTTINGIYSRRTRG